MAPSGAPKLAIKEPAATAGCDDILTIVIDKYGGFE
jgi:hypothetical protein